MPYKHQRHKFIINIHVRCGFRSPRGLCVPAQAGSCLISGAPSLLITIYLLMSTHPILPFIPVCISLRYHCRSTPQTLILDMSTALRPANPNTWKASTVVLKYISKVLCIIKLFSLS